MGFSKLWSGGRKVKYVVNYSRMIATSAARRGEGEGGCVEGKADPPAGGGGEGGGKVRPLLFFNLFLFFSLSDGTRYVGSQRRDVPKQSLSTHLIGRCSGL